MKTQEDLAKQIKLISQNAWRQDGNTTLNTMVEYIVREALVLVMEIIVEQEARIEALEEQVFNPQPLPLTEVFNDVINLKNTGTNVPNWSENVITSAHTNKGSKHGKDGGISQPQRNSQGPRSPGSRADAVPGSK